MTGSVGSKMHERLGATFTAVERVTPTGPELLGINPSLEIYQALGDVIEEAR